MKTCPYCSTSLSDRVDQNSIPWELFPNNFTTKHTVERCRTQLCEYVFRFMSQPDKPYFLVDALLEHLRTDLRAAGVIQ